LAIAPKVVEAGLQSYGGLAHRCQIIAQHDGVIFVNDSKATNVDAAEKALLAFKNIHWIVGGQAKEGGITRLAPLFDRVIKAYLVGNAADGFADQLGDVAYEMSGTVEAAVKVAAKNAKSGDVVLLAPACASFDQFSSFEARGDAFVAAVKNEIGG
jgi:UDP-N-acetylmuramoylalanine--D-glutamate ligase